MMCWQYCLTVLICAGLVLDNLMLDKGLAVNNIKAQILGSKEIADIGFREPHIVHHPSCAE